MKTRFWPGVMLLVLVATAQAQNASTTRKVVDSEATLPRHSYALTASSASALLDDDVAFNALAAQVRSDLEATLRDYDIRDQNAQVDLYGVLRNLALLRGDVQAERAYGEKIRASAIKPAAKLTGSLLQDAAATAASVSPDRRAGVYRDALAKAIEPMPWSVVQETLKGIKGSAETPNAETLMRAQTASALDAAVQASGRLSDEQAKSIIRVRASLKHVAPYNKETAAVIGRYIDTHQTNRVDIWPARAVSLSAAATLQPVVLAVWDEGVDVSLFPGRLFVNAKEKTDGRDDDGNGYVDDVHGISFDENDAPAIGPMLHFDDFYPGREAELRELATGHADSTGNRPTAAAAAFRRRAAGLKPEQVGPLMEAGMFYDGYYSHGTHVAGIAMEGNPAARLLVVRQNSNGYHTKPVAFTDAVARRYARNVTAIVAYMRQQHVRVVNMSFGDSLENIEKSLEANNIGATPAERVVMAVKTLGIEHDAFAAAMRSAPDILFVPAAGNSNSNLGFSPDVPAGIDLPNVLAVGAVDQFGDAASFTSYGKQVAVYANGYEVDSVVPGGFHERKSGTSMAAPQVTNLAAKLFALKPSLTPAECSALIKKGATPSADGKLLLIDPANTVAMLKKSLNAATMP